MNAFGCNQSAMSNSLDPQFLEYSEENVNINAQRHPMPSPSTGPWNLEQMPWTLASASLPPDGVMEFNAPIENRACNDLHQKRKSNMVASVPNKQFISEEKITAHFNGLHISSDYIKTTTTSPITTNSMDNSGASDTTTTTNTTTTTGKCFTNLTYEDYQITAKELEEKLLNANSITVCEEVRKLNEEHRKSSFMPEALMNRVAKPCTALVLWQPPPIMEIIKEPKDYGYDDPFDIMMTMTGIDFSALDPNGGYDSDDEYIDNNNTCAQDFNNTKTDLMDEDL